MKACTNCGRCNPAGVVAGDDPIAALAGRLAEICGCPYVHTDTVAAAHYGSDETLDLRLPFDILVKPGSADEIAAILRVCDAHRVAVTPRGGGSGVTGGALPCRRGVVLSLERLNKIISIHPDDALVVCESGVVTDDLCRAVEAAGLYFPVAPTSRAYSMVGGNVAENAGSISSCRYGSTAGYVLNLEVVLPNGEILWTGANVAKNVTGLNLTQLFVGSEGTLGIITKVVYRLLPLPAHEVVLLTAFGDLRDACAAVVAIKRSGLLPSAVELIHGNALRLTAACLDEPLPLTGEGVAAHLLLELHEQSPVKLTDSLHSLVEILEKHTSADILVGSSAAEKQQLRKLRYNIGNAMKRNGGHYRDLDMAVPVSFLYDFIRQTEDICRAHGVPLACFGHALDGNLHTMLLAGPDPDPGQAERFGSAVRAIYACGIAGGGVLSGEHGIGLLQKEFMPMQFPPAHLALLRQIKSLFDPNHILNPGKLI